MFQTFKSAVVYGETIDFNFANKEKDLLIVDRNLLALFPNSFANWTYLYPVTAGELLKEWSTAAQHIQTLGDFWGKSAHRQSRVIVCGGGSIGDLGGFYASIFKRGVELVHVPTTWLAAIDSAHGGKNGLNLQGAKNQIGTFYPAHQVYIFKEFLAQQPQERVIDGFGEYIKIKMIENGSFDVTTFNPKSDLAELLWSDLKMTVESKYLIVQEDPLEISGVRVLLNLGHTFGHILETLTGASHGLCVLQGIDFALNWSEQRGFVTFKDRQNILQVLHDLKVPIWSESLEKRRFSKKQIQELFKQDKKMTATGDMQFIFIKSGERAVCQRVTLAEFTGEIIRQGWMES